MWARVERVHYRSGICDWNADAPAPDSWVCDSRTEIRQELCIGPWHFRCHSYMQLLPAGTCLKIGTLVLPGDMQVRQLLREPSIPNTSTPKDGMPMRPDVPLYLIWCLYRSGDTVTLDGETFLGLQEAPHLAEASTLDKQSGVYYEEHEATNHSACTCNSMACLASLRQSICLASRLSCPSINPP